MLVYDSTTQREVVPTMPAWVEPHITMNNSALTKADSLIKSEEVKLNYTFGRVLKKRIKV